MMQIEKPIFKSRGLTVVNPVSMRIAQVAPLYESVPPRLYGGSERVVSYLTEELVRQGHQVTLFASGDSQTKANLAAMCPTATRLDPSTVDPYRVPGRININKTQYFEGVPPEVWEFYIGGYQVLQKWLKDRRERQISYDDLTHYQQVVVALQKTI